MSRPRSRHAICVAAVAVAGLSGLSARAQPAAVPPGPPAPDRAELDRTQITGSRELPKVLYIVPWKQPPGAPPIARPERSVIDDALAPVERRVLQRQIGYHRQLTTPSPGTTPQLRP